MKQLGLPVLLNSKMRLGNFVGEKNGQILSFIDSLFASEDSNVVVVSGAKSTGKTHLLQGCTFAAMDRGLSGVFIDLKEQFPASLIAELSSADWVCIDNIHKASKVEQQELFDLYNQIKHTKTQLIVSLSASVGELELLSDLKTRLSLAVNFSLETLTDEQKIAILQNKMSDKNTRIDSKIYTYLFKYYSRDLGDLISAINQLDEVSLGF
ncbi:MAG: DnaA regulatory inactivator Hda [Candidatus Thioglobus sp.]|nr:MAG: DnaA regulatory inactivator Hda [Candidatus Thioglobus sp.]